MTDDTPAPARSTPPTDQSRSPHSSEPWGPPAWGVVPPNLPQPTGPPPRGPLEPQSPDRPPFPSQNPHDWPRATNVPGWGPPPFAPNGLVPTVVRKDLVVAYVFLLFLGHFGVHKFYVRNPGIGALYLTLMLIGVLTSWLLIGFLLLIPLWVMLFIDLFTLPEQVRRANFWP